jgi:hypothetical protein
MPRISGVSVERDAQRITRMACSLLGETTSVMSRMAQDMWKARL